MKIRKILAAIAISLTSQVSAQWDTLNTGVDYTFLTGYFFNQDSGVFCGYTTDYQGPNYFGAVGIMTVDGGVNWQEIQITSAAYYPQINAIDFDASGKGFAACSWGYILRSSDYGARFDLHWIFDSSSSTERTDFYAVEAINDSMFFIGGENGTLLRTLDFGSTWDTLSSGTLTNINDIYFEDAANGWIAADGGYLAMTSDSGNTWDFVSQPFWGFADFNSITLQGSTGLNPYVVGESGIALFSNNSGTNWFPLATDTTVTLNAVRFGTQNAGLICGDNGFIFRSDNGGATWISETSASNVDLYDIAFAGDTTAFICGDSGVVLRSNVDISSVHTATSASLSASAYPNPFSNNLSVNVTLESTQDVEILITDVTGQLLSTSKYSNTNSGANRFEISGTENISAGLYFITVIANERKSVLPVVRQ